MEETGIAPPFMHGVVPRKACTTERPQRQYTADPRHPDSGHLRWATGHHAYTMNHIAIDSQYFPSRGDTHISSH